MVEDQKLHAWARECIGGRWRGRGAPPNLGAYPAAGAGSQITSTHQHHTRRYFVLPHTKHGRRQESDEGPTSHQRPIILLSQKSARYAAVRPCAILVTVQWACTWTGGRRRRHGVHRAGQVHHVPYPPAVQLRRLSTNEAKAAARRRRSWSIGPRACMRSPQLQLARPWVRRMVYLYVPDTYHAVTVSD